MSSSSILKTMPPLPNSSVLLPLVASSASTEVPKDSELQNEVVALFETSRPSLLRYLKYIGVHDRNAEEVVQDVFLALFQHLRMGRGRHNLRAWVRRVAHNLGLKQCAAARRIDYPVDDSVFRQQVDPAPNPEQQVNAWQRQVKLLAVFHSLPEQDRCCLHLRAEGLRYREIAKSLGISVGSVAVSLSPVARKASASR